MTHQPDAPSEAELIHALPFGVASLDADLRVAAANLKFASLVGVGHAALVGRLLDETLPALAQHVEPSVRMTLQGGTPILGVTVDVGSGPWRVDCLPCRPGAVLIIQDGPAAGPSLDVDARFRAVFDRAPVGMLVFDWRDGRAQANHAFRSMLGYSDEEMSRLGVQGITHAEDFAKDATHFQRLMLGEIDHYELDKRYLRSDGTIINGRLTVSLLRAASGEPHLVISTVEDTSEQKRRDEEREKLIAALKDAVQAREVFLLIASHELRTPLTPLRISLQLAAKEIEKLRDEESPALVDALRQVDRLNALVSALLDTSAAATGRLDLEPRPLALASVLEEVVSRFRAEAERAGSTLSLAVRHSVTVRADRLRIEQVLANLLSNAIKFGQGGPIEVELDAVEESAKISVRDQGIGIDPEHHARVFGRFERAVSEMRYGGLGLGLYLSREIVRAHGGNMLIESRLGRGATFIVELPVSAAPQAPR